jgi:hypothetical protein
MAAGDDDAMADPARKAFKMASDLIILIEGPLELAGKDLAV